MKHGKMEVYGTATQNIFNTHFPRACPAEQVRQTFHTTLKLAGELACGLGMIVGPSLHQTAWAEVLKEHNIRCGYWVPFLHRDLSIPIRRTPKIKGIRISSLKDFSIFSHAPHPYIGKVSTPMRKAEVSFGANLVRKGKAVQLIAWDDELPVGAAMIFFYRSAAAMFNVGVHEPYRGRGIGNSLMLEALRAVRSGGAECAVLSAARKAIPVYERVGFTSAGHYGSYYIGRDRLQHMVESL